MRNSFSFLPLLVLLFFLGALIGVIHLGVISITFYKLGLSTNSGILLLLSSLLTSIINIPILTINAEKPVDNEQIFHPMLLHKVTNEFMGETIIAINVGGCVIPLLFSLYLFIHGSLAVIQTLICVSPVILVSYFLSRPIPGIGIGIPILVAPLTAAIFSILLGGEQRAALAYISGTLGVLIGADLLRLKSVRYLGAPLASIGGAGTFDGIFITGLVAVLLT